MQRRDFMKSSAFASSVIAASRLARGKDGNGTTSDNGVDWEKAPCRFCGTGCHVQVGVKGGQVVAIRGDQNAAVNQGLLCVKGYHVGLALYGKDRLTKPLLRKNGKLEPISWDEALEVIADRIEADPKGFAMYGSGQWTIPEGYAATKFVKGGLGTNLIDPNARLCMASAVTGFISTYGVDEPAGCYDDLDRADVVILWGNNPAEMHPILFSRIIDRRGRGEKVTIIDIGTRKTRSTEHADKHLLFRPQTDHYILNALLAEMIQSGTWDRDFVEKNCAFRADSSPPTLEGQAMSFDEFKAKIRPYTLEEAARVSGVPLADLKYLAQLFARKDIRITSLWCMGANQHTRGTAVNNLLHGIHLLSGHFGKPGDAPTSLTGQPSACGTVREVGTLAHALPGGLVVTKPEHRKIAEEYWRLPEGRISAEPGPHTVALWRKFSTPKEKGGNISTVWVQVTNPARSLPNIGELFLPSRQLKDKFLIVSDVYPTQTVLAADLVLPSAMWVEKNGMVGNSERRTQQWFKMVEPPGEARDDAWQIIAVAHKLFERGFPGMRDRDGRFLFHQEEKGKPVPIWEYPHYYDVNVDERLFEEYRPFTRKKHKDLAPYSEYVKARGLRWPVTQKPDGSWRETRFRFAAFDDPYVKKGREVEFYHSTSGDGRAQIWFRPYADPPEVPDAKFPYWLCTGRVIEHWHTGTMTMRIPQLARAMPGAYVEMNSEDARELGIGNGDKVTVESRRGQVTLPAWLRGRGEPPRGTVFVPFFDERAPINLVTLDAHDPFSKQPDYKKCAVSVRPAGKGT